MMLDAHSLNIKRGHHSMDVRWEALWLIAVGTRSVITEISLYIRKSDEDVNCLSFPIRKGKLPRCEGSVHRSRTPRRRRITGDATDYAHRCAREADLPMQYIKRLFAHSVTEGGRFSLAFHALKEVLMCHSSCEFLGKSGQ